MSLSPQISVVMPVYNATEYLAESIGSILAQSFTDFEFIIVDDASTDTTPQVLARYATQDKRIRIITNSQNLDIGDALNRGLAVARAPLVARMDADDWSHPERFAKQYAFMQAHPEVIVCGTCLTIYETGVVWQYRIADVDIRAALCITSPLAHPTVMFRKETVLRLGGYDVSFSPSEDYDLWTRLAEDLQMRFANIPEVLLRYRVYPDRKREQYKKRQMAGAQRVRRRILARLGLEPTDAEMRYHLILAGVLPVKTMFDIWSISAWARRLLAANAQRHIYHQQTLHKVVYQNMRRSVRAWLSTLWVAYAPEPVRKWYRIVKKFFG